MQKTLNFHNFSITFYYTFLRVQLKTPGFSDEFQNDMERCVNL